MMKELIVITVLLFLQFSIVGQKTIYIDGEFEDWNNITPVFVDNTGDGQNNGIDIKRVWAYNDDLYIYFRFELTKEINLQENNDLAIYLDYDNNLNSGFKINGIGAEIRFFFGDRFGVVEENNDMAFVNFPSLGLLSAPTVSSTEFEISFLRAINEGGINFSADPTISFRIEDNSFNGDEAPNDLFGIEYTLDQANKLIIPDADLKKPSNVDFRFMTYNIENDQLFDPSRKAAFQRIFQALQPDIIALQEIRDFNSTETKNLIEEFLPGQTWYHEKHGFDIVTISRYPIQFSERVNGNAAFYLDVNGQDILLINCHLPCCENDVDRQIEVDIIMEYIRELKNGNGNFNLNEGTPIIIAGDMNFVGDANQPYTFRTGDILNNGFYGPDFSPDWDNSELEDANPYATNSFGNFTWLNINGSFYPGKLDWIFYTNSKLSIQNTFALYTPGLSPNMLAEYSLGFNDVLTASGHLPVVADYSFSIVGVDDFVDLDITLFPNPARDILNITHDEIEIIAIKIISNQGCQIISVEQRNKSLHTIDISALPSGSYFLIIETTEGRMAKPFLKVR